MGAALGFAFEQGIQDGHHEQRDKRGKQKAADNGERERLLQFGAGAEAEGKREKAEECGERGHQNGTDADFAGGDERFAEWHVFFLPELVNILEENDAVFHDEADHQDNSHERGNVERGAGDEQHGENAKQRERSGRENNQRGAKFAELNHENDEHGAESEAEYGKQIVERSLLAFILAADFVGGAGGEGSGVHHFLHVANSAAEIAIFQACCEGHHEALIFALQVGFAVDLLDGGERGKRDNLFCWREDRELLDV